jgi:hypothetical protein
MYDTVLVTGNRDFKDYDLVRDKLIEHLPGDGLGVLIVGDATGADRLALWVHDDYSLWIPLLYKADWKEYGKAAGPMRNAEMVKVAREAHDSGHRVLVLAFALEEGVEFANSGGTSDCLRRVRAAGLPYEFYVSKKHTGGNKWRDLPSSSYLL